METCYYWYHHCMIKAEEKERIENLILSHDYKAFCELAKKYNAISDERGWMSPFFPEYAFLPETKENLYIMNEENFSKINYVESECG